MANRPHPRPRSLQPAQAEALAAEAFGRIAADEGRLGGFLDQTGLGPEDIRRAAAAPGFLAAILDHVLADEGLLLALAEEIGQHPESFAMARAALAPEADED